MSQSQFVISLDFELMWGVRDKRTIESYGNNIRGVRQVIPSLLELFERYDISATFATVGFLFARTKTELLEHTPSEHPRYQQQRYSPYADDYIGRIGRSEADDLYHYGASLIELIRQSPRQELATHTFSHYYCLEGASLSSFEADMLAAKAIAAAQGITLQSIVFPRNQYSPDHLAVCRKLGFTCFRGNEASAVYQPRKNEDLSPLVRGTRLTDTYLNITGHHCFRPHLEHGLVNIPASRFLRPYNPRLRALDALRLQRIKNSMTHGAITGQGYHLWWHPHNFGINLKENLAFLEAILEHYRQLHKHHGMRSSTMGTIAQQILQAHAV